MTNINTDASTGFCTHTLASHCMLVPLLSRGHPAGATGSLNALPVLELVDLSHHDLFPQLDPATHGNAVALDRDGLEHALFELAVLDDERIQFAVLLEHRRPRQAGQALLSDGELDVGEHTG